MLIFYYGTNFCENRTEIFLKKSESKLMILSFDRPASDRIIPFRKSSCVKEN